MQLDILTLAVPCVDIVRRATKVGIGAARVQRCAGSPARASPTSGHNFGHSFTRTKCEQTIANVTKIAEYSRIVGHPVPGRTSFFAPLFRAPAGAGRYLQASTIAFYLVASDRVWVDANPKETELTYVRPGQLVTVTVDTYPDLEWYGTVESISPAAAQEFQLLPAQNTSGNWVKVVQRIPMRVRVDTSGKSRPPLRAGMSVEVDVYTGHSRGVPHFLTALLGLKDRRAETTRS